MNFNSWKIASENDVKPNSSFRGQHSDKAKIIIIAIILIGIIIGLKLLN